MLKYVDSYQFNKQKRAVWLTSFTAVNKRRTWDTAHVYATYAYKRPTNTRGLLSALPDYARRLGSWLSRLETSACCAALEDA